MTARARNPAQAPATRAAHRATRTNAPATTSPPKRGATLADVREALRESETIRSKMRDALVALKTKYEALELLHAGCASQRKVVLSDADAVEQVAVARQMASEERGRRMQAEAARDAAERSAREAWSARGAREAAESARRASGEDAETTGDAAKASEELRRELKTTKTTCERLRKGKREIEGTREDARGGGVDRRRRGARRWIPFRWVSVGRDAVRWIAVLDEGAKGRDEEDGGASPRRRRRVARAAASGHRRTLDVASTGDAAPTDGRAVHRRAREREISSRRRRSAAEASQAIERRERAVGAPVARVYATSAVLYARLRDSSLRRARSSSASFFARARCSPKNRPTATTDRNDRDRPHTTARVRHARPTRARVHDARGVASSRPSRRRSPRARRARAARRLVIVKGIDVVIVVIAARRTARSADNVPRRPASTVRW